MRANITLNTPYVEFDLEDYGCDEGVEWNDLTESNKLDIKSCLYGKFCADMGFSIDIEED